MFLYIHYPCWWIDSLMTIPHTGISWYALFYQSKIQWHEYKHHLLILAEDIHSTKYMYMYVYIYKNRNILQRKWSLNIYIWKNIYINIHMIYIYININIHHICIYIYYIYYICRYMYHVYIYIYNNIPINIPNNPNFWCFIPSELSLGRSLCQRLERSGGATRTPLFSEKRHGISSDISDLRMQHIMLYPSKIAM